MRFSELKQYRDDLFAQGDSAAASNRSMESQRKVSYVVERGIGEYVDDLLSIPAHLLPDSFMDTEKREMNVITLIETQLRQKLSILDVGY